MLKTANAIRAKASTKTTDQVENLGWRGQVRSCLTNCCNALRKYHTIFSANLPPYCIYITLAMLIRSSGTIALKFSDRHKLQALPQANSTTSERGERKEPISCLLAAYQ